MSLWSAIALGFGPSLFWLWLVHRHDDHEREPWSHIVAALALGALSVLGVLWSRPWLADLLGPCPPLLETFVLTALNEEVWKIAAMLPLLCCAELDEPLDGVVYGAACGLGFAGVENVLYAQLGAGFSVPIQRAFTATLLHAACSGSFGFALAMVKLDRGGRWRALWPLFGLLLAVTVHGLYDAFLDGDRVRAQVSLFLVLPAALYLLTVKMHWARARSPHYHPDE
ncbi:MAG: PrsW family intramembrane metalloprotease [Planctomycetes bacterium]|nr:PrsW family intramembrane metalloprotease [Planctomycetota bacterium]